MASWPPGATGAADGARLRFRETPDRGVHRHLDPGPPVPGHLLPRGSTGPRGRPDHSGNLLPRIRFLNTRVEAAAEGPTGRRGTLATDATGLLDATTAADTSP